MATPCSNNPDEVIEKIVSAKSNADKFDRFVNGTDTETVQLGSGDPTPTIRNAVRQIKADGEWLKEYIATAPEGDISLNNAAALLSTTSRTLAERFADIINVKDFGAKGDGETDDADAVAAAIAAATAGDTVFFPDGIYILSPVAVEKKITILAERGAVLKLNPDSVDLAPSGVSNIFTFSTAASGSSFIGGVLDGNREILGPIYLEQEYTRLGGQPVWEGIRLNYCHNFTLQGTVLQNFVQNAFRHAGGDNLIVNDIVIDQCSRAFQISYGKNASVKNIKATNINNGDLNVFQHGCEIRFMQDSVFSGIKFVNFSGNSNGLDSSANCFGLDSCTNCIVDNLTVDGYGGDTEGARGVTSNSNSHCIYNNFVVRGYEIGLNCPSSYDCVFSNFVIDGEFFQIRSNGYWPGMNFTVAGVYRVNATLAGETNANVGCKNCVVSDGIVTRSSIGIRCESSYISFNNVFAIGNLGDGFEILEFSRGMSSHPKVRTITDRVVSITACKAICNGGCGVLVKSGEVVKISNSDILNNGQDSNAPRRAGVSFDITTALKSDFGMVLGNHIIDTQDFTVTNAVSYDPESIDSDNCIWVRFYVPGRFNVGQNITLVDANDGSDVVGKIIELSVDDAKIKLPSGASLSSNTYSIGTGYSDGRILHVTSGDLINDVPYAMYLKHPTLDEYVSIRFVNSETQGLLESAFSQDIPAGSDLQVVGVGVSGIPSQQNGLHIGQNSTAPILVRDNFTDDNLLNTVSISSSAFNKIASGSEFVLAGETTLRTNLYSTLLNSVFFPVGYQVIGLEVEVIEEITGASDGFKITLSDSGSEIYTVVNPWSSARTVGTTAKLPSSDAPAFTSQGGVYVTTLNSKLFTGGKIKWRMNMKRVVA